MFNEITAMQGMVQVLAPLLPELGNLRNPDGGDSGQKAIYLSGNKTIEADYPRVVLSMLADKTSQPTRFRSYKVDNNGTDEFYTDTEYHVTYIVNFQVESGNTTDVLTGQRLSANTIARKVRSLLRRESVRKELHTLIESGINSIFPITPVRDLDGNDIVDQALLSVTFTTLDVDTEQLQGVIDYIDYTGTWKQISEEDPNPTTTPKNFTAPDEYINN
ncbi:hypothetical protein NVP1170O_040 [Vibrio phage 1.170.O._10N.261.52.C3]|nr:hypothetical protein NVP1170O_040 [Vibrio phage 1.170.O._10N.261.52.C3]